MKLLDRRWRSGRHRLELYNGEYLGAFLTVVFEGSSDIDDGDMHKRKHPLHFSSADYGASRVLKAEQRKKLS